MSNVKQKEILSNLFLITILPMVLHQCACRDDPAGESPAPIAVCARML